MKKLLTILIFALGIAIVIHFIHKPVVTPPTTPTPTTHRQAVKIYTVVAKANKEELKPIQVYVDSGKNIYANALSRLFEEVNSKDAANPIPRGTKVLGLELKDGLASVNLSKEFRDNFQGGSDAEAMTIGALLKTLAQFPKIKHVRLLVDGKPLETLGHLDLSEPLDVKWTGQENGGGN